MPFFSIIIPTYNRADKLMKSINSVLSQTDKDFELIIIDDGSTDKTQEKINKIDDKRIIYKWIENYGGPSRPRNIGISIAQGEWIAFLDADDWWESNKLEICRENIRNDVDLIYHDLLIIDQNKKVNKTKIFSRQLRRPVLKDLLVNGNIIANSSVVVRKSILLNIGGIDEKRELFAAEDYNTWLRISKISDNFLYLNKTLGFYLMDGEGISEKNMSLVYMSAIKEFLPSLSKRELNKTLAFIFYMDFKFKYSRNKVDFSKIEIFKCIIYGNSMIKIKSLYILIRVLLKYMNPLKFNN